MVTADAVASKLSSRLRTADAAVPHSFAPFFLKNTKPSGYVYAT